MSFRARIFALILVVAVAAIGTTAYLSFRLTARQISDSQRQATQHVADIADTVRSYARRHGSWAGVAEKVRQLSRPTTSGSASSTCTARSPSTATTSPAAPPARWSARRRSSTPAPR
ncbi:hypothetical protein [Dactylosporangium darangshiense]|uniref:hypothetical protein n=1 Tax=Dactylosporangium darangshiense TaxID=579108 RepID=UPI0036422F31